MLKIAKELKDKNIAEYLIYMWQVEDLLRAYNLDIDLIEKQVVEPLSNSPEEKRELLQWYSELVDMMYFEGVKESGHLQININVIIQLTELHSRLLATTKYPFYNAAYFKALPFIVELRSKSENKEQPELEVCFEALYGVMLLRLQQKEVTKETNNAVKIIANFVSMLANFYAKDVVGELKLE